jgi:hypothetical protein
VPRSTLRRWDQRQRAAGWPAEVTEFFESPAGLEVLTRIVAAVEFVLGLVSPGGVRLVCMFLQLSGLDAFVASSVGSVHKRLKNHRDLVVEFGREQRELLGSQMQPKDITVCQDETFHPNKKIGLVGLDAASNFILVEEYATDRKTETWDRALEHGVAGLPVRVIQCTTDEAKALKAHAESLDANHSPDVFHIQREGSKATSLPLHRLVKKAEQSAKDAMEAAEMQRLAQAEYEATKEERGPGRPPDFESRIAAASAAEEEAYAQYTQAVAARDEAKAAVRRISDCYHPFSLETGVKVTGEELAETLEATMDALETVATRAGLPDKSMSGIAKARRVVPAMVETMEFVHQGTIAKLAALTLSPELCEDVEKYLVAGRYLEAAACRAETAEERRKISATAGRLLDPLDAPDHPLQTLSKEKRAAVEAVALECAQLFQRSSSCVEGRNGYLALQKHGLHNLSPMKLESLTVIHNYFSRRADGTTAAERFFGLPHADLFEHVLQRMPPPARPSRRRSPSRYRAPWRVMPPAQTVASALEAAA